MRKQVSEEERTAAIY